MTAPKKVTTDNGAPISDPETIQRIGSDGPLVLHDTNLIETLAHFNREFIPPRNPHAVGSGAFGEFIYDTDISDVCSAALFNEVGLRTPCLTRFSTVAGDRGSADTVRDVCGFSTKFYTKEGNLDWVFNNTPVFFVNNPIKFPQFIHTQRPNSKNLPDFEQFWLFFCENAQESLHQVMVLFSNRGTPYSYKNMNGYSGHTYVWTNSKGEKHYVQVHLKTDHGIKNFTNEEAVKTCGENPLHRQIDLHDSIASKNYPSWTVSVQVMSFEEASKLPFSVFDITKVWPHDKFPLRRIGKLVLNENPTNYFAQVEQAAFSPANMIPYMEASNDPMLVARLLSYPDAHRARLGKNYSQIPVNCPYKTRAYNPLHRDGKMQMDNFGSDPRYFSTLENYEFDTKTQFLKNLNKGAKFNNNQIVEWKHELSDIDFVQPAQLWKVLGKTPGEQKALIHNVASHLQNASPTTQDKVCKWFNKANVEIGTGIKLEIAKLQRSSKL